MMTSRSGLKSLTREVLVSRKNAQHMHAPIGRGKHVDTYCYTSVESVRLVETSLVESHYEPCGACFALDDVGNDQEQ
jgi:hypothetical protein